MKISIFGLGYVGCVSLGCLAKNGHDVIGVDVSPTKVNQINSGLPTIIEKDIDHIIKEQFEAGNICATTDFEMAILQTEVSIIAVGTPSTPHGHLNLDYIFKVAEDFGKVLANKDDFHVIAIRSTVMPGTADRFATIIEEKSGKLRNIDFAMVSNPEFLREGTAVYDYFNPPLTLLGAAHEGAAEKLASLYSKLPGEMVITDIRVAEIMKYINNTFHALKISFANEVGNICSELGIDSHKVMEIFCKDKTLNISPYYLKPGFAYGGSCLPKDLKGLQTLAHDLYVKTPVINSIHKTNEVQIQRAIDKIIAQKKKKLGFLGLSFKAGTDDLRNSPAVSIIESLIGKGYDICIYDKNVQLSHLTGTNKEYIEAHIPHLSKLMAADIQEVLDHSEVIVINNKEKEYADVLSNWSGTANIIDMVRIDKLSHKKATYQGINW
jgi:GDP-mannose 6-dehydrogenase